MTDWKKRLRRSFFRGVPFWVEYDQISGGKRLAIHEVAGADAPEIEELGLKTRSIDVTAYVIGEASDLKSVALIAAMQAGGAGLLVLPLDAPRLVYAEEYRRSRERDRMGYIAFDLRFVPGKIASGVSLSIGDVSASVSAGFTVSGASVSVSASFGVFF